MRKPRPSMPNWYWLGQDGTVINVSLTENI